MVTLVLLCVVRGVGMREGQFLFAKVFYSPRALALSLLPFFLKLMDA